MVYLRLEELWHLNIQNGKKNFILLLLKTDLSLSVRGVYDMFLYLNNALKNCVGLQLLATR